MKTQYSIIKHIIFISAALLISSGMGRLTGSLDYNSLIPNKYVAILFFFIGLSVMSFCTLENPKRKNMNVSLCLLNQAEGPCGIQ